MRWVVLCPVAVPMAALAQPVPRERLVAPALPGFVVGHDVGNARGGIREEIPQGETVHAWTRMVTTQRFTGVAAAASPQAYIGNSLTGLRRACPGARIGPITALRVSGRPAAQVQVDCPRSAGGSPETFIMLAIAGPGGTMHVKQVAWRGRTTPQGLAWGRSFLTGVALCTAADRTPRCR